MPNSQASVNQSWQTRTDNEFLFRCSTLVDTGLSLTCHGHCFVCPHVLSFIIKVSLSGHDEAYFQVPLGSVCAGSIGFVAFILRKQVSGLQQKVKKKLVLATRISTHLYKTTNLNAYTSCRSKLPFGLGCFSSF